MKKDYSGKKLLVLAGADVHRKVVSAAKEMGVYVIVTDILDPSLSPAKQIADEYRNIDITDVDSIVKKCAEERVDGLLGKLKTSRDGDDLTDLLPCYCGLKTDKINDC